MKIFYQKTQNRLRHPHLDIWKYLWIFPLFILLVAACSSFGQPTKAPGVLACGTIVATTPSALPTDVSTAEHIGSCFWTAYQHCQTASLTYKDQHAHIHVFTLQSHRTYCEILDTSQAEQRPEYASTYICTQLHSFRGGYGSLVFSGCGKDETITIVVNPAVQ
ncbi:MAG: hypothetical protein ABI456_21955 [Ktedonobacteraceae bacterium]|nr:hypothetical protein [Chloroflexota bacterium]